MEIEKREKERMVYSESTRKWKMKGRRDARKEAR